MFTLYIERSEPLSRNFQPPQETTWNSANDAFGYLALMGARGRREEIEEAMRGPGFEFTTFDRDFYGEFPTSRYRVRFDSTPLQAAA